MWARGQDAGEALVVQPDVLRADNRISGAFLSKSKGNGKPDPMDMRGCSSSGRLGTPRNERTSEPGERLTIKDLNFAPARSDDMITFQNVHCDCHT